MKELVEKLSYVDLHKLLEIFKINKYDLSFNELFDLLLKTVDSISYPDLKKISKNLGINANQKRDKLIIDIFSSIKNKEVISSEPKQLESIDTEELNLDKPYKISKIEYINLIRIAILNKMMIDYDVNSLYHSYEVSSLTDNKTEIINQALLIIVKRK